jgi:hypothetical protein
VTTTRPLTPHTFITNTTTVRCLTLCRYRRMAMHRANLRTRHTAAVHRSQVSALLYLSCVSLPPLISTPSNPLSSLYLLFPLLPVRGRKSRIVGSLVLYVVRVRADGVLGEANTTPFRLHVIYPTGCTETSTRSPRQVLTQWYIYLHEVRV